MGPDATDGLSGVTISINAMPPDSPAKSFIINSSSTDRIEALEIGKDVPAGFGDGLSGFFVYSKDLKKFVVDKGNNDYKDIDGILFNKAGTVLLQYPWGRADTVYAIPTGVTRVGYAAFYGNDTGDTIKVEELTIPASVTAINASNFMESWTKLKTVNYKARNISSASMAKAFPLTIEAINIDGNTVEAIPSNFLAGNTGIGTKSATITIPYGVRVINSGAFNTVNNIKTVYFNANLDGGTAPGATEGMFYNRSSITTVHFGNDVRLIPPRAFQGCSNITNIALNRVTNIGANAFDSCNLNSLIVPIGVSTIGASAFANNGQLTEVTFGDTNVDIGTGAFMAGTIAMDNTLLTTEKAGTYYFVSGTGWVKRP
jgi:hypothetical protein